jgi:hypothetical protein
MDYDRAGQFKCPVRRIVVNKKYFHVPVVVLLFAAVALGACSSQAAPSPTATSAPVVESPRSEPVTLRLAIPDGDSVPMRPM